MNIFSKIKSYLRENLDEKNTFYYACNDVEQEIIRLKELSPNSKIESRLNNLMLELNSIRMDGYKALSVKEKHCK